MALLIQGNTTLNAGSKGDKGDDGLNGGANPNIIVATSVVEITTAGVGAIIDIQDDITLLANYTPPENQTWWFSSGKIDLDTYKITGVETHIIPRGDRLALDCFSGELDGTWRVSSDIYGTSFGMLGDGNIATDNKQAFIAALWVVNSKGGNLLIPKGEYYLSIFPATEFSRTEPQNGYVIGRYQDNVNLIGIGLPTLQVIPHAINGGEFLKIQETTNSSISGFKIIGDRLTHTYTQDLALTTAATANGNIIATDLNTGTVYTIPVTLSNADTNRTEIATYFNNRAEFTASVQPTSTIDVVRVVPTTAGLDLAWLYNFSVDQNGTGCGLYKSGDDNENGHGVHIFSNCNQVEVHNNIIHEWIGDAVIAGGDVQFQTFLTDSNFTLGTTIDETGTLVTDADFMYSDLYDITGQNFIDAPWYFLTGTSFGGSSGLRHWEYWAVYYDGTANDGDKTQGFIDKSPMQDFYKRVELDPEYASQYEQIRIVAYTKEPTKTIGLQIRPSKVGFDVTIRNNDLGFCRRQGISNPDSHTWIYRNRIHDIGVTPPGFGIDIEDGYRFLSNIVIEENIFTNNRFGDIILKECEHIRIIGNMFEAPTRADWFGDANNTNPIVPAIYAPTARYTIIEGNQIANSYVEAGRRCSMSGNQIRNGHLSFFSMNCNVSNNIFSDTKVSYSQGTGVDGDENGTVFFDNNYFYITNVWVNWFIHDFGSISHTNTKVIVNDISELGDGITEDISRIESGNGTQYFSRTLTKSVSDNSYGSMNGFILKDLKAYTANRGGTYGAGVNLYNNNIKNSEFSTAINFENGLPRDFEIVNTKINGGINFDLDQYTSANAGYESTSSNTEIIIKQNTHLLIDDVEDVNSASDRVIRTGVKDVNFIMSDSTIEIKVACTGEIFDFAHYGDTLIKNCKIISYVTAKVIDTTGFTTDTITFKDVDTENVTFNLRAGDKLLYTKPNTNCPSYIDNATALAALGEGYYYKDTTTSKFEVTIN